MLFCVLGSTIAGRGAGAGNGTASMSSLLTVLRLMSFGHAGPCVYICAVERSVGPNGVVKTRTITVFRGHLNFDHSDICRLDTESTIGVGFS